MNTNPKPTNAVDGRVPPHDLESEAAVLSACMLNAQALDKVVAFLRPEHFYSEAHRRIFEAMLALSDVGQPHDIVQVGTWLKSRERINQIGGLPYLTEILNATPAIASPAAYATTILEKWRLRQMIATCQRFAAEGYFDVGDPGAWLESVEQAIHDIARNETERQTFGHIGRFVKQAAKSLQSAAALGAGGVSGTPTGFSALDRITTGMHGGELWVLAARPGMGKTAYVEAICRFVASHRRVRVTAGEPDRVELAAAVISSLEMPGEQLALRGGCAAGRVRLSEARAAGLGPGAHSKLTASMVDLSARRLWIDERSGASLPAVRATIRQAKREAEKQGAKLRVAAVDYLQLMSPTDSRNSNRNREQEISEITRGLKACAKDEEVCIIALSQLNRKVEERADKRPVLSDLRESGAIEQDADTILFLYREEYYRKRGGSVASDGTAAVPGATEVIIAKQRNGPLGMVKVLFDAPSTRFDDALEEGWT